MPQNVLITGTGREGAFGLLLCADLSGTGRYRLLPLYANRPKRWKNYGSVIRTGCTFWKWTSAVRSPSVLRQTRWRGLFRALISSSITPLSRRRIIPYITPLKTSRLTTLPARSTSAPSGLCVSIRPCSLCFTGPQAQRWVVNISSGAGCITTCRNDRDFDYCMIKCAMNMSTKILYNKYEADKKVRVLAIHPGWMRTQCRETQRAPFDPYEHSERMRQVFEARRESFDGVVFVDYDNQEMPW